MSSVFPVLGSVNLSGATSIIRKEKDYIQEHQIAGKDGGLVERVGSASTRWEIKGMLRESGADGDYASLKALLGTTSNLSIPTFGSGYFLAASGTVVFVESFGGNWMPGYGYPRYDYSLKLVSTGKASTLPNPVPFSLTQSRFKSDVTGSGGTTLAYNSNVAAGNELVVLVGLVRSNAGNPPLPAISDSLGNSFTVVSQLGAAQTRVAIGYVVGAFSGANTITIASVPNCTILLGIYEMAGVGAAPTIVQSNPACSTVNITTTQSTGNIDISCLVYYDPNTTATINYTGTFDLHFDFEGGIGRGFGGIWTVSTCAGAGEADFCYLEAYF